MRLLMLIFRQKAIAKLFCISVAGFMLSSCAVSNSGAFLEAIVAPDDQLQQSSGGLDRSDAASGQSCSDSILSQLPNGFPNVLCHPASLFLEPENQKNKNQNEADLASEADSKHFFPGNTVRTRWTTNQPIDAIQEFYQTFFDKEEWQVTRLPSELNNAGILQAVKGGSRITIRFSNFSSQLPNQDNSLVSISKIEPIEYTVDYRESAAFTSYSPMDATVTKDDEPISSEGQTVEPSLQDVSEKDTENNAILNAAEKQSNIEISDLESIPDETRAYVEAVIALGIVDYGQIRTEPTGLEKSAVTLTTFHPNEPITRREFARWLVQANNRLHEGQASKQIRLANPLSEPAFADIGTTDPDFRTIQGLAEAGLLPSKLSSNTGTDESLFRADAPLTRETLLAWKIPLDIHKALPPATVETIQETWGFQDATKITPKTLSAIAADYVNGDRANLRRAFGYTLLFQPQKSVTRAEAAAALGYLGTEEEGISAIDLLEDELASDSSGSDLLVGDQPVNDQSEQDAAEQ